MTKGGGRIIIILAFLSFKRGLPPPPPSPHLWVCFAPPDSNIMSTSQEIFQQLLGSPGHYHRNLAKTREAVKKRVSRHYHENITKSREAVNRRVLPQKFVSTSTARQYMKDLLESRSKSGYTSSMAYRKKAEVICRGKRDRYSLAEPKKVEVTCLIEHFQDTFTADNKLFQNCPN